MNINGTNIAAGIVPYTTEDTFATHDSLYGKGGWKEVDTIEQRDAIPSDRLRSGCIVYVTSTENAYIYKNNAFELLNLGGGGTEITAKEFKEVSIVGTSITIDYTLTPYSIVTLRGESATFALNINNITNNQHGQILVMQEGGKVITIANPIYGDVTLPTKPDTVALLTYNKINGVIYIYTDIIISDSEYPLPSKIDDFIATYYDNTVCSVQWTAPYGNTIEDIVTEYDMRYSNSIVDVNSDAVWNSLHKLYSLPTPGIYGTSHSYTITGLKSNSEYYVYIKAIKVNNGVRYISQASDPVYFRTKSDIIQEGYSKIDLHPNMINVRTSGVIYDSNNILCLPKNMVDEDEKDIFNEDGTPDTTNRAYTTKWHLQFNNLFNPWQLVIDLHQPCLLNSLYLYSVQSSSGTFRIFYKTELSSPQTYLTTVSAQFNQCQVIDMQDTIARFIIFKYDNDYFGTNQNDVAEGEEFIPTESIGNNIGVIHKVLLYGRKLTDKPLSILPPARKTVPTKTVGDFFNVVGWFYMQGRILSLCSGPYPRLFGSTGHFSAHSVHNIPISDIATYKITPNVVPWVSGNNGTGQNFIEHLRDTYDIYGLKPFIASSSWGKEFYVNYKTGGSRVISKPLDGYWLQNEWRALPSKGLRGYETYFNATTNPANYKTLAKMMNQLMAVYGVSTMNPSDLDVYPSIVDDPIVTTNLNYMSAIEIGNENDGTWSGWLAYTQPQEMVAWYSACYDGHCGTLTDENGNSLKIGVKNASPSTKVIQPGMVNWAPGYINEMYLWAKENRPDGKFPMDALNVHYYFSNKWKTGYVTGSPSYATTLERQLTWPSDAGIQIPQFIDFRNRYLSDKEIWITEFGYGESGGNNTQSQYQCYSQPGRILNGWLIPDRHRSEVKGAWTVRAVLSMLRLGIDLCNYYSIESDNYFDDSKYGSGAGFEMFRWNDETDTTPGAKYNAIQSYMHNYDRGGFATTGLFNSLLWCGAYPISTGFWYVTTMRNRLKDYIYTGQKFHELDDRIVILCFRKKDDATKGAYVIWLNDDINTGIPNVTIPLPTSMASITKVTTYWPQLPNPQLMPSTLEFDEIRTGLPTTRKEKYINGEWVIQNKKYGNVYETFAQGAATYPSDPQEGDEVYVLPTALENPYFPIVGPVGAIYSKHLQKVSSNQYEWIDPADPVLPNGDDKWAVKYNSQLSYRQINAVCDYIEYTEEGQKGTHGEETIITTNGNSFIDNVSEFPAYYFFDAIPDPDFKSNVTDVTSVTINSSTIKIYWNNTNTEDTAYEIFMSTLPESGYSIVKTIAAGIDNYAEVSGLNANTTYYFKVRPIKDSKVGTLSSYTFAKTYAYLPIVSNLQTTNQTTTTISLSWDYDTTGITDFSMFAIYRAESDGIFTRVGVVTDINARTYTDTELSVGTVYIYKLKVYSESGFSDYTSELNTSTLTVEEAAPTVQKVYTDKVGTLITIEFDLPIATVTSTMLPLFTLTENGVNKTIISIANDSTYTNRIKLGINSGTLQDYNQNATVILNYNKPSTGFIVSQYGIAVNSFTNTVKVNVGNYDNLQAIYKINLCSSNSTLPSSTQWNNLIANVSQEGTVTRPNIITLHDNYNQSSNITLQAIVNGSTYQWGGVNESNGTYSLGDVEEVVYKTTWFLSYSALNTENIVGRVQFNNLNPEYTYIIKAYASAIRYNTNTPDRYVKIKVNGVYSNLVQIQNNSSEFCVVDSIKSDITGTLNVDFITNQETKGYPPNFNFFILKEYSSNTSGGDNINMETITLSHDSLALSSTAQQLSYTYSPSNATNLGVTWSSSNNSVATVSASGLVTPVANGACNIIATATIGTATDSCAVTVTIGEEQPGFSTLNAYFDVTLPETIDKETVTLEMPILKYNKSLVFSYITDDTYSIYQNIFAPINKRYTVTDFNNYTYHLGMSNTEPDVEAGYYPTKFMQYTDGAGINHRYKTSVACWPDKLVCPSVGIGGNVGKNWPYISEKEYKFYKDFGYTLLFHDMIGYDSTVESSQTSFDSAVNSMVSLFQTNTGVIPKTMAEPGGDHTYLTWARNNNEIHCTTAQGGNAATKIKKVYPFSTTFTLDKQEVTIERLFAYNDTGDTSSFTNYTNYMLNQLATYTNATDKTTVQWLLGAAHRSSAWETNLFNQIHNIYGDTGTDTLWFATIDEVYEYWYVRTHLTYTKTITETGVRFNLKLPMHSKFWYNECSFLLSNISSLDSVNVTSSSNINGTSFAINSNKLLVNLNYDPSLTTIAEKYVSKFEATPTEEYAYDNAQYFVNKLKTGVKEQYQTRIDALVAVPTVDSIIINGGDASTNNLNVTVVVTTQSTNVTHYMIAEDNAFTNGTWVAYTPNINYTITNTSAGTKTIYLKLKNQYGESNYVSDTIEYILPDPVVLSAITLNNGVNTSESLTIPVTFTITSGIATHYRFATSSAGITDATWVLYGDGTNISYTFDSYGEKTLYAQLKNSSSTSNIVSDGITLTQPELVVVFGNITTEANNTVASRQIDNVGYVNNVGANGTTSNRTIVDLQGNSFCSEVGYALTTTDRTNFRTTYGITGEVQYGMASWDIPTLSSTPGLYPNSIVYDGTYRFVLMYGGQKADTTYQSVKYLKDVPQGTYTIKILCCFGGGYAASRFSNFKVRVQNQTQEITDYTTVLNNNSNYLTFENVTVDSSGMLFIGEYPTVAPLGGGTYRIPPITVIEIRKTA